ncbi:MAG: patatin-like phospholipase family protein, partial [Syntrophomonadaceae bacterium]|nr:patatin-like phospholipase family protein [Syntrophomonadaceae bacterium]
MKKEMKLGLALSGGGFRAAFFHLGVLAGMASRGLLRHVEVISTVSGGSIIGALYYLHLKRLLESKADEDITDKDYEDIIARLERDFLAGVQRNIRMRTFLNPLKNLRMSRPDYSRSDRIGELYDQIFFRPVLRPGSRRPVEMRELEIRPRPGRQAGGTSQNSRQAKVPTIKINATTLNTGHNWRFTPRSMGEPERKSRLGREIDKNSRLLMPPSYRSITVRQQNIELGHAVAASTGVPGLFPPLSISGLYPGLRVQLVDGGVHDNQGIQGLLDANCTHFVVSDASGAMPDDPQPSTQVLPVMRRVIDIFADRLREEQLLRLIEKDESRVALIYLLKGMDARVLPWISADGRPVASILMERRSRVASEDFGVRQSVQRLLSQIRTDLDTFTELEAYSLMLCGYRMSCHEFERLSSWPFPIRVKAASPEWKFTQVAPLLEHPSPEYIRQLKVASSLFLKVFRLEPPLAGAVIALLGGGLAAGCIACADAIDRLLKTPLTLGQLLLAAFLLTLGLLPRFSRLV